MAEGADLLDDPVSAALGTAHRHLALGDVAARRYVPAVGPFAAIAAPTAANFAALGLLAPESATVALLSPASFPDLPSFVEREREASLLQMVRDRAAAAVPPAGPDHVVLAAGDVAAMLDLAGRTAPGPFGSRTIELGHFIGVRDGDRLVAMAGERMRVGAFVEISGVCTDPAYRGRGLATLLMTRLIRRAEADGLTPFLHSYARNTATNALYARMGFAERRRFVMSVLRIQA